MRRPLKGKTVQTTNGSTQIQTVFKIQITPYAGISALTFSRKLSFLGPILLQSGRRHDDARTSVAGEIRAPCDVSTSSVDKQPSSPAKVLRC